MELVSGANINYEDVVFTKSYEISEQLYKDFKRALWQVLIHSTEGGARTMISKAAGDGFEAWRILVKKL